MSAVPVMAHQRAVRALRVIVLPARETVVEEERHAARERGAQAADEAARGQLNLAAIAVFREPCRVDRVGRERRGPGCPRELSVLEGDAHFHDVPALSPQNGGGHCVQHFVADHNTGEFRRQPVQPCHALEQVRRARGERVAGAVAQVGRDLEHQVAPRRGPEPLEFEQQVGGERAAARADLQHVVEAGLHQRVQLARQRAPEQRRNLRRGDEITVAPELARAGHVVAKPRLVERQLDVTREADPAAVRLDLAPHSPADQRAVRAGFLGGRGQFHH